MSPWGSHASKNNHESKTTTKHETSARASRQSAGGVPVVCLRSHDDGRDFCHGARLRPPYGRRRLARLVFIHASPARARLVP